MIKDRPVILHRACWHIAVVNTKALEIAGVDLTATSHNVKHGAIDVDEKGATGVLREDVMCSLINAILEDWGRLKDQCFCYECRPCRSWRSMRTSRRWVRVNGGGCVLRALGLSD